MLEWLEMELWIAAGLLITFSPNTHLPFANLHTYAHTDAHANTRTLTHTNKTHMPSHLGTHTYAHKNRNTLANTPRYLV